MKLLRNSILAATTGLALATPSVYADSGLPLHDNLSVTGFLDMSLVSVDPESGDSVTTSDVDQFEVDFLFDVGNGLSAQVDLQYLGGPDEVDVEQAFLNYQITDSVSFKAGRFLSYSGWETAEPTGLYQYSGAGYAGIFYGGYQQGVSALYATETFDLGLSVVNDLAAEGTDSENLAVEVMVAVRPVEGWTAKAFYMTDELEGTSETIDLINVWTSYAVGGLTLAAEYNTAENSTGLNEDSDGYLLMANYAWGKYALTLRYHAWELEDAMGATFQEISGFTFSPSYAVSDNLLIVTEIRTDEDDVTGAEWESYAIEALFTF